VSEGSLVGLLLLLIALCIVATGWVTHEAVVSAGMLALGL